MLSINMGSGSESRDQDQASEILDPAPEILDLGPEKTHPRSESRGQKSNGSRDPQHWVF
jgi:hypothetical protein